MKIFLAFIIFWFHNFDLFQVKVKLIFKFEVNNIVFLILDYSLLFWYEIRFDCNLLKIVLMLLVLEYVHIARLKYVKEVDCEDRN
jgi:hypothetical protein